jgi:hypothetical protein
VKQEAEEVLQTSQCTVDSSAPPADVAEPNETLGSTSEDSYVPQLAVCSFDHLEVEESPNDALVTKEEVMLVSGIPIIFHHLVEGDSCTTWLLGLYLHSLSAWPIIMESLVNS